LPCTQGRGGKKGREPMSATRREFLAACAAAAPALLNSRAARAAEPGRVEMGVVIHSYGIRGADKESHFNDPLTFLEYCHGLGAAGVQTALGARDEAYSAKVRARTEEHHMYVEGSSRLPRDKGDVERFAA